MILSGLTVILCDRTMKEMLSIRLQTGSWAQREECENLLASQWLNQNKPKQNKLIKVLISCKLNVRMQQSNMSDSLCEMILS